jgi:cytochrome c
MVPQYQDQTTLIVPDHRLPMKSSIVNFVLLLLLFSSCEQSSSSSERVLVFSSRTPMGVDESTTAGIETFRELGEADGFMVDTTTNVAYFFEDSLARYNAVVFLNTSGDVLNDIQQAYLKRYIEAGGGFVGLHDAAATEPDWYWYRRLLGGRFEGDPVKGTAMVTLNEFEKSPEQSVELNDEWHTFSHLEKNLNIVATALVKGSNEPKPISWYHEFQGGRAFYTALGNSAQSFKDPKFVAHLLAGMQYVIGEKPDYSKSKTPEPVEQNRFTKTVLEFNLDEPIEMAILPDSRILFIERKGNVKLYTPSDGKVTVISKIPAWTVSEDGLIGLALDPDFSKNQYVYVFYSHPKKSSNVLSRFVFQGDSLDLTSEREILEVPTQRERCCHTGGSLLFAKGRVLFISTGDNTSPFESEGYSPSDELPGRSSFDAQKSSSNTNDLRGKILRIIVNENGTYDIPEGNLFPKGEAKTRPEIYVMGNRNPYRISVDSRTGYLYWGEVGPDAGEDDPVRGPRGYDEVNRARKAGFFGWPYFVGNNFAYGDHNFVTKLTGAKWDPARPINDSPNNTGKVELPPATAPIIWYPYLASQDFPMLKNGGRNAMAGPIYYSNDYQGIQDAFPSYLDGKLLIYDWIRNWLFHVSFDENEEVLDLEPFMASTQFSNVIDMAYGPDGKLYMIEYGQVWFKQNMDARLSRIDYNPNNRPPVVQLAADRLAGAVPLTVNFNAQGTFDYDKDVLDYRLEADGKMSTAPDGKFRVTFDKPGTYTVTLTARDPGKLENKASIQIVAGNEPPKVNIEITGGNRSFYFPGTPIAYRVHIDDLEDGTAGAPGFPTENATITFNYLEGYDATAIAQGHQVPTGKVIMDGSDCKSCHQTDKRSAGPSYLEVAQRYKKRPGAIQTLGQKIVKGGAGNWGAIEMAAHPQLSIDDAEKIVEYIFSLTDASRTLPLNGKVTPGTQKVGYYILSASYSDKGGVSVPSAVAQSSMVLSAPRVRLDEAAELHILKILKTDKRIAYENVKDNAYARFNKIDFNGVTGAILTAEVTGPDQPGGTIELRLDAVDGPILGSTEITGKGKFSPLVKFPGVASFHDLYIIFRNQSSENKNLFYFNGIEFINK